MKCSSAAALSTDNDALSAQRFAPKGTPLSRRPSKPTMLLLLLLLLLLLHI
jgi:hypothetical protein